MPNPRKGADKEARTIDIVRASLILLCGTLAAILGIVAALVVLVSGGPLLLALGCFGGALLCAVAVEQESERFA